MRLKYPLFFSLKNQSPPQVQCWTRGTLVSLKLFERHTRFLCSSSMQAQLFHIAFWSLTDKSLFNNAEIWGCPGKVRSITGVPFQMFSTRGDNDFLAKESTLGFLLKKLFVSLPSKCITQPKSTLVSSAILQKLNLMLIKCNRIYCELFECLNPGLTETSLLCYQLFKLW